MVLCVPPGLIAGQRAMEHSAASEHTVLPLSTPSTTHYRQQHARNRPHPGGSVRQPNWCQVLGGRWTRASTSPPPGMEPLHPDGNVDVCKCLTTATKPPACITARLHGNDVSIFQWIITARVRGHPVPAFTFFKVNNRPLEQDCSEMVHQPKVHSSLLKFFLTSPMSSLLY
jgi:hypothetical protein